MTNKDAIEELKYSIEPNQGFMECRTGTISEEAIKMAIEALTEAEQYKLALFAAIRNSTVMPAGVKLGKNMHEINKMSVETMHEVLKMCDFEKLRESYKDGEEE